jgi:hypothetical protein
MSLTNEPIQLKDALYAFSLAKPVPDAALLDEFARRYPQYASELTDFAVELAVNTLTDNDVAAEPQSLAVSPAVARAMSRFHNHLFAVQRAEEAVAKEPEALSVPVANPLAGLSRDAFRGVARGLNANSVFLVKVRDRLIDPVSMTGGFKQALADQVKAPLDVILAHVAAPPHFPPGQSFKADQKPQIGAQQSFEDAVRNSALTEEQQRYLLNL